jgi:hypothetical protein
VIVSNFSVMLVVVENVRVVLFFITFSFCYRPEEEVLNCVGIVAFGKRALFFSLVCDTFHSKYFEHTIDKNLCWSAA